MEEMDRTAPEGAAEAGGQPPWNPFPVSARRFCDVASDDAVWRFASRDSFDQCVAALRDAAGRTLGPLAGDFMRLMDMMCAGRRSIDRHEATFGWLYTEAGEPCAARVPTEDMARLAMYLADMVLLLDAGAAFEGGEGNG